MVTVYCIFSKAEVVVGDFVMVKGMRPWAEIASVKSY
jgi:hypothetical protein